jgi:two-component system, oxyanion-binding sensor
VAALLRALYRAAQWCGDPANHEAEARLLSLPGYVSIAVPEVERALSGKLLVVPGKTVQVDQMFVPFAHDATFPWASHALWFYAQMVRWGDVAHGVDNARRAEAAYRPDLYRAALGTMAAALPEQDSKQLGAEDFFDRRPFDPAELEAYIASQQR